MRSAHRSWSDEDRVKMSRLIDQLMPEEPRVTQVKFSPGHTDAGKAAMQVHEISVAFLRLTAKERATLLSFLEKMKDVHVSSGDMWRILSSTNSKLRTK